MKGAHLRLVADNSLREPDSSAAVVGTEFDFHAIAARMRCWIAMCGLILGAPFRFIAAIARICVAAGRSFFVAIYQLCLGTIGLGLIFFVGYGLLRVILHPLFR